MRLQIIIQLKPNKNIGSFFTDLPDVFLPVFWFDAEASVTEDIAAQLNLIGKIFPFRSDIRDYNTVCCRNDAKNL